MKRIYKFLIAGLIFSLLTANLISQQILTPDETIAIALKNNYDILLSRNEAKIGKAANTAGNAGMYPDITLNAGANMAVSDAYIVYSNGNITDKPSSSTNSYNASIAMNWTLFDGFKMFTSKRKLNEIEKAGDINYQYQLQKNIASILESYFDIVRQKQILTAIREIKALSRERMIIGETRFKSGMSAKTEYLQAQIDFNTKVQSEIQQEINLLKLKRELNRMINRDLETSFEVTESVAGLSLDSAEIEKRIIDRNPHLRLLKSELSIKRLSIKETESRYLPYLNLNASYGFNKSDNNAGFVSSSRNIGPNLGLSLTYPIFQGGDVSRQVQIGEIEFNGLEIQLASAEMTVRAQFLEAYSQYKTNLRMLEIENATKELAKENLFLSIERLKLSQTTSLEVRDAQVSYENSLSRLSNIIFAVKSAETQLKMLMGSL